MSENETQVSEDLKQIVSTTIESIREGLRDKQCGVAGLIEFEIAVIKSKEAKGGFRFLVADALGNYSKDSISKISLFSVIGNNTQVGSSGLLWLDK